MKSDEIIGKLPYTAPFLFVDELKEINKDGVSGTYWFDGASAFYKGHFKNNPVTPGAILTECCAQIGVVCLGIYLLQGEVQAVAQIGLSSSQMEFLLPVYPNERVTVVSEKVYFRFQKLKCRVKMFNASNELVCKGEISGMFKTPVNGRN